MIKSHPEERFAGTSGFHSRCEEADTARATGTLNWLPPVVSYSVDARSALHLTAVSYSSTPERADEFARGCPWRELPLADVVSTSLAVAMAVAEASVLASKAQKH